MPGRGLLLLATAAAACLFFAFVLFSSTSPIPQWRHPPGSQGATPAEHTAADTEILKALQLSGPFDFRRRCLLVRPTKSTHRSSLAEITGNDMFRVPASQDLALEDVLPLCQDTIKLDVPYFDPSAKIDTSELFLGMATSVSRINASLTALSKWLSGTRSPLLVLLVDPPNTVARRDDIESVRLAAAQVRIELIFEPYNGDPNDSEGLKNFALAAAFVKHQRSGTRWYGIIDDDTFFRSLPATLDALKAYNSQQPYYIGALSEGFFRVANEGFLAWGGAGIFISSPLMALLGTNTARCRGLDNGFGDHLWRDCILEITSPTVHLTQLAGLNQIDVWGDISGFYESGLNPLLTLHHWKSWHFQDIPLASSVSRVAGPDTFLQRYLFPASNTVLTNGFSLVHYPHGLPDLNRIELTFAEDVNILEKPGRMMFHHSLGATRPALQLGKEKMVWNFSYAVEQENVVRQFYVSREGHDSVIEIDWLRQ